MEEKTLTSISEPQILFEDEWLLVIEKPAGWVVNRSESVNDVTIQDWLENNFNQLYALPRNNQNKVFYDRSGVAHRLDKDTSGILLASKNPETLRQLMELFKIRHMQKQYIALVHGNVSPSNGFVRLPIARNIYNRHQFSVDPMGKHAHTDYQLEAKYQKPDGLAHERAYSLLRLAPKTGRTHQIRVHCRYIGHPLVSDALYTSKNQLPLDLKWCPRHFLHAAYLSFTHPETNQELVFESELARDLQNALGFLEKVTS